MAVSSELEINGLVENPRLLYICESANKQSNGDRFVNNMLQERGHWVKGAKRLFSRYFQVFQG